jgi:hypothetical protein
MAIAIASASVIAEILFSVCLFEWERKPNNLLIIGHLSFHFFVNHVSCQPSFRNSHGPKKVTHRPTIE